VSAAGGGDDVPEMTNVSDSGVRAIEEDVNGSRKRSSRVRVSAKVSAICTIIVLKLCHCQRMQLLHITIPLCM
jgi:hypothetical protein